MTDINKDGFGDPYREEKFDEFLPKIAAVKREEVAEVEDDNRGADRNMSPKDHSSIESNVDRHVAKMKAEEAKRQFVAQLDSEQEKLDQHIQDLKDQIDNDVIARQNEYIASNENFQLTQGDIESTVIPILDQQSKVHDALPPPNAEEYVTVTEKKHPFHFYAKGLNVSDDRTGTILAGGWKQEGVGGSIATIVASDITSYESKNYYLTVTWASANTTTVSSVVMASGASTPANTATLWYYDVLEFDADGKCIEHMQDDLILPESNSGENDHSFHYRGDGRMTVGGYRFDDSSNTVIPTPTASNYKTISPVVNQAYWIKVDWTTSTATNFNPAVTFEQGGSFPTGTTDMWIYPLIEFDGGGICIERQQGNIQLGVRIPVPSGSNGGCLVYTSGDISWAYAESDYTYIGRKADDSIDFDYPRFNAGTP